MTRSSHQPFERRHPCVTRQNDWANQRYSSQRDRIHRNTSVHPFPPSWCQASRGLRPCRYGAAQLRHGIGNGESVPGGPRLFAAGQQASLVREQVNWRIASSPWMCRNRASLTASPLARPTRLTLARNRRRCAMVPKGALTGPVGGS